MKASFVSWFCHTPVSLKFTLGTLFILKTQFCATHGLFTCFIIFKQNEQESWLTFPSLKPSVLSSTFPVLLKGGLDHSSHPKYHWAITESDCELPWCLHCSKDCSLYLTQMPKLSPIIVWWGFLFQGMKKKWNRSYDLSILPWLKSSCLTIKAEVTFCSHNFFHLYDNICHHPVIFFMVYVL